MDLDPRSSLRRLSVWSGLALLTNPAMQPTQGAWAQILPVHIRYQFVFPQTADAELPAFTFYLRDAGGSSVYKFECHAGGYPDDSEMSWSGDFQCALFPYRGDTVTPVNLLAVESKEEQGADWWNRGRLLAKQLQAPCTDYPEYSALRHFRLRSMDLSLSYTDVSWIQGPKGPRLQKFTLNLDAAPDKDAKSPMAEKADGSSPPKSCYP
ncbi:MAG TPA: hypothetical protein VGN70_05215 [Gammaproteobacteria bacterium]|jgi:hypothetical protein